MMRRWAKKRRKKRWERYLDTVPITKITSAHDRDLGRQQNKLHQGLRKVESSLAIQLRTEKVVFVAFFHARRVYGVISLAVLVCQCGWRRQDPKHMVTFRENHSINRRTLYEAAGMERYRKCGSRTAYMGGTLVNKEAN